MFHCAIQFTLPQYSYAETHSTISTAEIFLTSDSSHVEEKGSYKYSSPVPVIRNPFNDADTDSVYIMSNYFKIMNRR